jgi:hypothetical protein
MKKSLMYGLLFWVATHISFRWGGFASELLEPVIFPQIVGFFVYFAAGVFYIRKKLTHPILFFLPAIIICTALLFTTQSLTGLVDFAFLYTGFHLGRNAYMKWQARPLGSLKPSTSNSN